MYEGKHILVLLIFIIGLGSLSAQSPMFRPFGSSFEEVQAFLESRDYLSELILKPETGSILAYVEEHVFEYQFYRDQLYCVSVSKVYLKRRTAEDIFAGCLDYMRFYDDVPVRLETNDRTRHYAVLKPDRIFESMLIPLDNHVRILRFISMSREIGPAEYQETTRMMAVVLDVR